LSKNTIFYTVSNPFLATEIKFILPLETMPDSSWLFFLFYIAQSRAHIRSVSTPQ